jgi:hypothetical protein
MDKIIVKIDIKSLRKDPETSRVVLFYYEPTEVQCSGCGWKGDASQLNSDCIEYSSDNCSGAICPECGEWECVDGDLHWETEEELEKRTGKTIDQLIELNNKG